MKATLVIPSEGAYFEGHFPGWPILPGVVELMLVIDALERATGRPVPLRGFTFARLRQLVLPGDRLDLTTREIDDGYLRFDLKRDRVLVANGELILGQAHEPSRAELSVAAAAGPVLSAPPLDDLLPHRPPMRFVTAILGTTADGLTGTACVPSACGLVSGGSVPALVGLEAAAQAAAAWEAMLRWQAGGIASARVGYLVSLRDVELYVDRLPADRSLLISVQLDAAAAPLTTYRVEIALDGMVVVRGIIATFLTAPAAE